MRKLWLAAGLAAVFSTFAMAEDGEYLFDLLKRSAHKTAWNAMLASGGKIPDWVRIFGDGGNGVASPSGLIAVGGQTYQIANVCKAHDCAGNEVHVLFSFGAAKAWGLLLETGKPQRFLGGPNAAQQQALREDLGK